MISISKDCKLTRVIDASAAGQTDVNSSVIDMQNFGSCTFIVGFGTIDATATLALNDAPCVRRFFVIFWTS